MTGRELLGDPSSGSASTTAMAGVPGCVDGVKLLGAVVGVFSPVSAGVSAASYEQSTVAKT